MRAPVAHPLRPMLLVGATLVALALIAAPAARAALLYDQTVGAGTVGVPSTEFQGSPADTSQAADDFTVPYGQHWMLSGVLFLGSSKSTAERAFNLSFYEEFGGFRLGPGSQIFEQRGVPADGGPNYSVPVSGLGVLNPGTYWVSGQAVAGPGDEGWTWRAHPGVRGRSGALWRNEGNGLGTDCIEWWTRDSCLAEPTGEPDQAFALSGAYYQVLATGQYGNAGRVVSSPPGIDCPGVCSAAFPRGTVVTLTGLPLRPNMEFTGWRRGVSPEPPPPGSFTFPDPTDLPCDPHAPCTLTLNEDMTIWGTYELSSRIEIRHLKRDLRDGSAKLFIRLPAAGAFSMTSGDVVAYGDPQTKPGLLRLELTPKGRTKRLLEIRGLAKARLRIKFRASGNQARTLTRTVTLKRRLPRRR